ncbi:hypothetical protein [uncultured Aquimarina sp.]|uniref:hypothetical protein n=1 Tax=uncultured Aquimarina sp. TaxID=575652 RepID=UPI00260EB78E|nr:hypothetical protein [uncultured Aquimarina sp.]
MKKITFKTLALMLTMIIAYSCEKPQSESSSEQDLIGELNDDILPKSREIAHIQKNGLDVKLFEIGDENDNEYEIFQLIKLYDYDLLKNEELMIEMENHSPFELFIELTDQDVAIPEALAKAAGYDAFQESGRTMDSSLKKVEILDNNYEEIFEKSSSCYNESENTFRSQRCQVPLNSNPDYIEFCDSQTWTNNTRQSVFGGNWRKLNEAFTWTNVICGQTIVKFYRYIDTWQLRKEVELENGIWNSSYWTVHIVDPSWPPFSPERRYGRRLRVVRNQSSTGSFRAYTRFRKKLYN